MRKCPQANEWKEVQVLDIGGDWGSAERFVWLWSWQDSDQKAFPEAPQNRTRLKRQDECADQG